MGRQYNADEWKRVQEQINRIIDRAIEIENECIEQRLQSVIEQEDLEPVGQLALFSEAA